MPMRVSRFVTATLGLTASVLTIWAERAGPLEVVAGLEVGPAGFALVAAILLGAFGALVSPTATPWCLARWRVRQRQFRELEPEIRALRPALIHDDRFDGDTDRVHDVEAKLRRLGMSILSPKTAVDYARFIEMAERGAWRDARRRFPAPPKATTSRQAATRKR